LVRTEAKKELLDSLGVNTVVGILEDVEKLTSLVSASDVVLNFSVPFGGGDASIQAIVDGLEARAAAARGGVKPVLLQTSGTGSVLYGSAGEAGSDVWSVSGSSKRSSRIGSRITADPAPPAYTG
jgi:hypothetical protein